MIGSLALSVLLAAAQAQAPSRVPALRYRGTVSAMTGFAPVMAPVGASAQAATLPAALPILSISEVPRPGESAVPAKAIPVEQTVTIAPDAAASPAANPLDRTASLLSGYQQVREGTAQPLPEAAGRYRYLMARGFLWEDLPGYMQPYLVRLRELGLDVELVDTDPAGTVETNGAALAAAIAASPKPVILIGHSKGALDFLGALRDNPGLQEKVAALLALQSPYYGTPVSDHILWRAPLEEWQRRYARLFNQAYQSAPLFLRRPLEQISRRERAEAPLTPPALRPGLRVFSVVTSRPPHASDGVVSPEQGVIPGAFYAALDGMDHVDTILGRRVAGAAGRDPASAGDFAESLVRWILRE
ncbi:MAG: hypothetical protein HYZ75_05625 [Elusimicrobia bacterium]|nr:hypothetical protein [Elusimicrobiota bacterium]